MPAPTLRIEIRLPPETVAAIDARIVYPLTRTDVIKAAIAAWLKPAAESREKVKEEEHEAH